MKPLETMGRIREVLADPDAVARDWKAKGGKVAGLRCLFVPEEIVWAASMLPYPLYGRPEPVRLADSYFQPCTCEFVRNLFDHALEDRFSFLDCALFPNTCDAMRRLHDLWSNYVEGVDAYVINNPQKLLSDTNRDYWIEELFRFKKFVERISGTRVTDERLREAIDLHNETRSLLARLSSLRKQDPPPLTGVEAFEIGMAVTILPKDRANPLLERLIEEASSREPEETHATRVLVTGSILDSPAIIRMIEEEGALVVVDDLCTAARYWWHQIKTGGDPMEAIHDFLNNRPLCACMHPMEARIDFIHVMIDEYDVDAVIDLNLKYCHPFLYEAPLLKKDLEARDVPVSVLETGHDMSGHGQLRTRIQAFLEMVE